MEDRFIMSKKELQRKSLLEAYRLGKLTLMQASERMGVSYRQAKRILKRYRENQDQGLIHQSRGRHPQNAYQKSFKDKVIALYQSKYDEFGPTFAAEKLLEDDGIAVHPETLRLWLKTQGLWHRKRKRQAYRERRQRRAGFGELLQIDGSIHQWFAEDETYYCLLNIVDDATGICLAQLDKGETTQVLLHTLRKWIDTYGIPKAVYVDLKSVYVSPKRMKEKYDDDLLVQEGFSVFEQVCKRLNIQIIRAYSPQAKGRVERKHAVFQDRFVKELRLYHINKIDAANQHLEQFIQRINTKFGKPKDSVPDTHCPGDQYGDLEQIICWQYKRQIRNDWTIQFNREYYQVRKGYEAFLKHEAFITIKRYLDGTIRLWHDDIELAFGKLERKPIPPSKLKKYRKLKGPLDSNIRSKIVRKNKHKSPWNQYNPKWLSSS